MALVNARITIDGAGRVVIPKSLRDELELSLGDSIELEGAGGKITLRPIRSAAPLAKQQGLWVFRVGQPLSAADTDNLLRRAREERDQE